VFAVPGWATYEHINSSSSQDAILFSFTDEPVLRSLGLYREAAAPRQV
jgi:gentisate 1,2-dioxygenase